MLIVELDCTKAVVVAIRNKVLSPRSASYDNLNTTAKVMLRELPDKFVEESECLLGTGRRLSADAVVTAYRPLDNVYNGPSMMVTATFDVDRPYSIRDRNGVRDWVENVIRLWFKSHGIDQPNWIHVRLIWDN